MGYETDTNLRKIGDGVHSWKELNYLRAEGIVQETGDGENVVMSQKAVTEKLTELGSEVEQRSLKIEGEIGGVEENKTITEYSNVWYKSDDKPFSDATELSVSYNTFVIKVLKGQTIDWGISNYINILQFAEEPIIGEYPKKIASGTIPRTYTSETGEYIMFLVDTTKTSSMTVVFHESGLNKKIENNTDAIELEINRAKEAEQELADEMEGLQKDIENEGMELDKAYGFIEQDIQSNIISNPLKGIIVTSPNADILMDVCKYICVVKDAEEVVLPKKIKLKYLKNKEGQYQTTMQFVDVETNEVVFSWYVNDGPYSGLKRIQLNDAGALTGAKIYALVNFDKVGEDNISGTEFVTENINKTEDLNNSTIEGLVKGEWNDISMFYANEYYSAANVATTGKMVDYRQSFQGSYCTRLFVKEGEKYKIYGKGQSNVIRFYAITDKDLNVLDTNTNSIDAKKDGIELVMPSNAYYLYINLMEYSSLIDRIYKYKLYNINDAKYPYNLANKTIVCFGDSVTQFKDGAYCSYTDYLARYTGAKVINVGIGGTQYRARVTPTITPTTSNQAWADVDIVSLVEAVALQDFSIPRAGADWINSNGSSVALNVVNRLQATDFNKVDIVTFFGGTNDWGSGGGYVGSETSVDKAKTRGAIYQIVNKLLTAYPHLKIYVFTPIVRWGIETSAERSEENWCDNLKSGDYTLKEYAEIIKMRFEDFKIPVCDMYNTLGWNQYNFDKYFTKSDGTHPYFGFEDIARKMAAFIYSN